MSRPLQVFKLSFLSPYLTQCLQLASDKSLREGIVGFPLAPGADGSMLPEHRPGGWVLGVWLHRRVVLADAAAWLASLPFTWLGVSNVPHLFRTPQAAGRCFGSAPVEIAQAQQSCRLALPAAYDGPTQELVSVVFT